MEARRGWEEVAEKRFEMWIERGGWIWVNGRRRRRFWIYRGVMGGLEDRGEGVDGDGAGSGADSVADSGAGAGADAGDKVSTGLDAIGAGLELEVFENRETCEGRGGRGISEG